MDWTRQRKAEKGVKGMSNPYAELTEYELRHLPAHLGSAGIWDEWEKLLTDLFFLEAKAEAGMVFHLAADLSAATGGAFADRPLGRVIELLGVALRRHIHFLARHPGAVFQCLWNSCRWHDCAGAAGGGVPSASQTETRAGQREHAAQKLIQVLQSWRAEKSGATRPIPWVRSLRPPPDPLTSPLKGVYRGHAHRVCGLAVSPDGRFLASGSFDRTVRIWDTSDGSELRCFLGHDQGVQDVAFALDGRRVASASQDGTVCVWDAVTGTQLHCFRGHGDLVNCVAFSPDGGHLASGSFDSTVRVWDGETGMPESCFRGHLFVVHAVAFAPDGQRLASAGGDGAIRVWDVKASREVLSIPCPGGSVHCVTYSPDGRRILGGGGAVCAWDAATGAELLRFAQPAGRGEIHALGLSPDGRWVVTGSTDRVVRVWDGLTGNQLAAHHGHDAAVRAVAFSPDGLSVFSGAEDQTIRVWDAASRSMPSAPSGHEDTLTCVSFSADGSRVATGSRDTTVRIWDPASGIELRCLRGHEADVRGVAFSPEGRRVVSASEDNTVRVWDIESGEPVVCVRTDERDFFGGLVGVAFSPDGRHIAAGTRGEAVRVWDSRTGAEEKRLRVRSDGEKGVSCLAFSPDGRRIATGSRQLTEPRDPTVRVWDVVSGQHLLCLRGHGANISGVAFSPDGRRIVSKSGDNQIRIWETDTGNGLGILAGDRDVKAVAGGASLFPWHFVTHALESAVESAGTGQPVAWFTPAVNEVASHPSGRLWAAAVGSHLHLLALEGVAGPPGGTGGKPGDDPPLPVMSGLPLSPSGVQRQLAALAGVPSADRLIRLIATTRAGLREGDIRALVPRLTDDAWAEISQTALRRSAVGAGGKDGGEYLWDLCHVQLRDEARRIDPADRHQSRQLHTLLADYLEALAPTDSLRKSKLMFHLLGSEDWLRAARYFARDLPGSERQAATRSLATYLSALAAGDGGGARAWVQGLLLHEGLAPGERGALCHHVIRGLYPSLPRDLPVGLRSQVALLVQQALAVVRTSEPDKDVWQLDLALGHRRRGECLARQGNGAGAQVEFQAGCSLAAVLAAKDADHAQARHAVAIARGRMAVLLGERGDPAAPSALQAFLGSEQGSGDRHPDLAEWLETKATALERLGDILAANGDLTGAAAAYDSESQVLDERHELDPTDHSAVFGAAVCFRKSANILCRTFNLPGAILSYQLAAQMGEVALSLDPGIPLYAKEHATNSLALQSLREHPAAWHVPQGSGDEPEAEDEESPTEDEREKSLPDWEGLVERAWEGDVGALGVLAREQRRQRWGVFRRGHFRLAVGLVLGFVGIVGGNRNPWLWFLGVPLLVASFVVFLVAVADLSGVLLSPRMGRFLRAVLTGAYAGGGLLLSSQGPLLWLLGGQLLLLACLNLFVLVLDLWTG
jgi:WD40 repeat protein